MNYLWAGMILVGIIYGAFSGNMQAVTDGALDAAKEAVNLCITMTGVMSLWVGVMEVARSAGLIELLSKKIQPFVHFLFPNIPKDHAANEYITTNIIANFLGLGWAATPAGLKAMESLAELEEERRAAGTDSWYMRKSAAEHSGKRAMLAAGGKSDRDQKSGAGIENSRNPKSDTRRTTSRRRAMPRGIASNEMCTFLILNISSLQLIPVNIIAYRSQYGSVNPTAIVGPGIVATAVSTGVAIVFCKMIDRKRRA